MGKFIPVEPEKWAEMVKAQSEVARLEHLVKYWKVEAETDNARWLRVLEENDRHKAEVERLTKAGDAMAVWIDHQHVPEGYPFSEGWDDAKEGKQP